MLAIGTRVLLSHSDRQGVIVGSNGRNDQPEETARSWGEGIQAYTQEMLATAVDSFYPSSRYPWIVKWDDGYQDVYADRELKAVSTG